MGGPIPIADTAQTSPVPRTTGLIGKTIEGLCKGAAIIAGLLFCIEMVMSVVSVTGRAAFGTPIPGDFELVQMLSAMGVSLCLPYCQLKKGHVFVDFFTLRAPPGFKRVLDSIAALLLAGISFVLAWRVWVGMMEMRDYSEATMVLGLPIWYGYIPVAPGFVLLGITALYTFVQEVRGEVRS